MQPSQQTTSILTACALLVLLLLAYTQVASAQAINNGTCTSNLDCNGSNGNCVNGACVCNNNLIVGLNCQCRSNAACTVFPNIYLVNGACVDATTCVAATQNNYSVATLYVATNSAAGNRVSVLQRAANGQLTQSGSFPTGGFGRSAGLGNQGAVALTASSSSSSSRYLLVVNAGSNELSAFQVFDRNTLVLTDIVPSNGVNPVSVTVSAPAADGNVLVYVLNAAGSAAAATTQPDNITGFRLNTATGRLTAIATSTRTLSAAVTGAAEVLFSATGQQLVVSEKTAGLLELFSVDSATGLASLAQQVTASGTTPFGFFINSRNQLVLTQAGAPSSVSSYQISVINNVPLLQPVTVNAITGQNAACWVSGTANGNFVYTSNSPSHSLTGFSVAANGALTLLQGNGVSAQEPATFTPVDTVVSADDLTLFVNHGNNGSVTSYNINPQTGALSLITTFTGLPVNSNGIATY